MNLGEHIGDLENTLAVKREQRDTLVGGAVEKAQTLSGSDADLVDTLGEEITALGEEIARFKKLETDQMRTAKAPAVIRREKEDYEGQSFTRMLIARTLAKELGVAPEAIAKHRGWGQGLTTVIKADVAGLGSGAGEAGTELIASDRYTQDFIEYLYGKTVYNQLPLREVPANITIGQQDGAATGYWVGESKAIPASLPDYNSVSLTPLKVAALAVCSKEWLRDASPSAEMLVRDALVNAAVQRIDTTFLSTDAAVAGVSPAGILNNISATASAGTDGDSVANDFKELMYRFTQAKNSGGQYIVMNPALATGLALLRNALDQFEFPNLTEQGGTIFGKPVVTGDNVNANHLIMLKPSDIYRISSGGLTVSISDQATIEMADNPAADTDTPTAPTGKSVSMFQTESAAFKVVIPLNFQRRRESAVAYISDADYGGAIST